VQHGLANVGESGESVQHGLANNGKSGESDTFLKKAILAVLEFAKFAGEWPFLSFSSSD
jgi:hypothetical protein